MVSLHQDSEKHMVKQHCRWIQISVKKHFPLSLLPHNRQVPVYRMDLQQPVLSSYQWTQWPAGELMVRQFEALHRVPVCQTS